jgi:hypothetical protein
VFAVLEGKDHTAGLNDGQRSVEFVVCSARKDWFHVVGEKQQACQSNIYQPSY